MSYMMIFENWLITQEQSLKSPLDSIVEEPQSIPMIKTALI